MSDLRFRLLGPLEAERGGTRLELGPRKQRAVLTLLLLEANRVVSSERLIDELWGDTPPETARSALQVYVSRLRKALGEDGASLRTQPPGYVLELEPGALDLQAFTALRAEARDASEPARAAEVLHEALALWRGAPLAELDGAPFAAAAGAQLEEQRLGALEDRIDADLSLGRHTDLIPELDVLVAEHPYRERFRAQQMLALYRSGRQAEALAAYRSARVAFAEGLGIEPGAALKALERQVLEQDPALAAPAGDSEPPRVGWPRRRLMRTAALVGLAVATVAVVVALRDESAPALAPPNSVAVIDPSSNRLETAIAVGARPGPIAAGVGAVWTGNLDDKTLTRIDPAALRTTGTTTLAATPTGVAASSDAVWVAHGLTGQISRVDPQLGGITSFDAARTQQRSAVGAIATGPGSVWAVFGDATLAHVDPRTTAVQTTFAGSRPTAVTEGGGGLWVISSGNSTVYRFNPATFLAGPIGRTSVGRRSTGIAYGHGAVWVTSSGDNLVNRIDPGTSSPRQIPVGEKPVAVAVDEQAVWVANAGDGTVSRVDPASGKVVATIEVGGSPAGIAAARGLVWVTIQEP